jgi:glycosyltransferase involved in cell wall biosynthesis
VIEEIKVLLIVPIYNKEYILKECIESIINQSYKNIKIILIDDCSTDSSYDIAKSFIYDKRITLLKNNKNMGCYYTRNRVLKEYEKEKWDIFSIHDADDISEKDRIKDIVLKFKNNNKLAYIPRIMKIPYAKLLKINKKYFNSESISHDIFKILNKDYKNILNSFLEKDMFWLDANNGVGQAFYSNIIFKEIGFFDNVKFGADDEYLERVKKLCSIDNTYKIFFQENYEYLRYISIIYKNNLTKIYKIDKREEYWNYYRKKIKEVNNKKQLYKNFNLLEKEDKYFIYEK